MQHLAKPTRFSLGIKIDNLFLEVLETVFSVRFLPTHLKAEYLKKTITKLDAVKFFLQIVWEAKQLDNKKYIALSQHLEQIGRMLGGWYKSIIIKTPEK